MKFPERFRTETISRLSDVAEAALLHVLVFRPDELPLGVFRARPGDFDDTRFAWAASQIAAELAAAPGITVDTSTGLGVVWEVATSELPRGSMTALGLGRRVGKTLSSWTRELAHRLAGKVDGNTRELFRKGVDESIRLKVIVPQRPRPRQDPFEPQLAHIKRRERELRAEFDGVNDRGDKPSAADRIAFVNAVGLGYEPDDLVLAMEGRAEKCRRSRLWQGTDTAESFLRVSWVLANKRHIDDAIRCAPAPPLPDTEILRTEHGTFVGGRQLFEEPAPAPPKEITISPEQQAIIDDYLRRHPPTQR